MKRVLLFLTDREKTIIIPIIKNKENKADALLKYIDSQCNCSLQGEEFELLEQDINEIKNKIKDINKESLNNILNELL